MASQIVERVDSKNYKQQVMKVSLVSIIVNVLLSILKLLAGIVAHSGAMVSDAIHSASDVFSTFVVMYGVNISSKKEDDGHPYGHERLECVVAVVLAIILAVTGIGIGKVGIDKIILGAHGELAAPGVLALVAAVASIIVKEWMYWYTRGVAKKINSSSLMADAWHHRSDSMSSIGSFVGILGARLGFPILDPIASVVICVLILKVAFDIGKDAVAKMVDSACDDKIATQITEIANNTPGVKGVDDLKTRMFASKIYVDIEIAADGDLTLRDGHAIAEAVHDNIEDAIAEVKHCMVHINPYENKNQPADK